MIPDESAITSDLRGRWQDNRRSSKIDVNSLRWEQLKNLLQSGKHKAQGMRRHVEEIVFSFTYPRLDLEVFVLPDFHSIFLTRFSAPFIVIRSICTCI
ncbi:hypothetical protein IC582_011137 [Cucumis melo]